jgi:ligand-binding SRPBCC domain-containing protein
MKLYHLVQTQHLPIPIEQAWQFFTDPYNLLKITPEWLDFRIVSGSGARLYPGMIIAFQVRPLFNLKCLWVTEITQVNAPHFFVDEMRFGPYRFWHHQHRFANDDDGVVMEDIIHYAIKGGPIGQLLNRSVVRPKLNEIFSFRSLTLNSLFHSKSQPQDGRS